MTHKAASFSNCKLSLCGAAIARSLPQTALNLLQEPMGSDQMESVSQIWQRGTSERDRTYWLKVASVEQLNDLLQDGFNACRNSLMCSGPEASCMKRAGSEAVPFPDAPGVKRAQNPPRHLRLPFTITDKWV